jgi:hypothetical protein
LQGPEPPELGEVLKGVPEGSHVAIQSALSYAAYAAAEEHREHLVHFSWAPAAGVVFRTGELVPPHLVGLFRLAALGHVRRHVHALVSGDITAAEHDKAMGIQLTSILTVAEKVRV